jgi:hypothetical protein
MRRGVLAVLAAVALAGCSTANTQTGLTRAQFAARADAVCAIEADRLAGVAAEERGSVSSLHDVARYVRHAVAIHEQTNSRLEALAEPPAGVTAIARWLNARTVATTVETDTAQALTQALPALASVQVERTRTSARAQLLARALGMRVCGPIE